MIMDLIPNPGFLLSYFGSYLVPLVVLAFVVVSGIFSRLMKYILFGWLITGPAIQTFLAVLLQTGDVVEAMQFLNVCYFYDINLIRLFPLSLIMLIVILIIICKGATRILGDPYTGCIVGFLIFWGLGYGFPNLCTLLFGSADFSFIVVIVFITSVILVYIVRHLRNTL